MKTTNEVATVLKVTPLTVRKWAGTGRLVGVKAGRDWRFEDAAIDDFLGKPKPESLVDCAPGEVSNAGTTTPSH